MKKNYDFDVVVVGSNHINTLGIIRSLGEKGIKSYLLLMDNSKSYVKKSRYIKETYYSQKTEKDVIDTLLNKIEYKKQKCYIIPTGDPSALIIDNNLNKLKTKYIVPNINDTEGEIIKNMDKYVQYQIAKKNNYRMAKTKLIDLNKENNENNIYPCILKPAVSADGVKSDIRICKTEEQYKKAIKEFKTKKYNRILLQEYLTYDYELDIPGYSNGKDSRAIAMIKKINIYPIKKGSTCYGKVLEIISSEQEKIEKMINSIEYNGIFDIDLFVKGEQIYLNEINFRNGALSYCLSKNDTSISLDWILSNEEGKVQQNKSIKPYHFMVEDCNLKLVLEKEVSIIAFIKEFFKAKIYAYLNIKDPKPVIFKIIYCFGKRRKK